MNEKLLNVSSGPHVRSRLTTGSIMGNVVIAMMPAAFFGVYHFGLRAFLILLVAVASAVVTELVFDWIAKKPMTIKDGSAVVTGLLLGLSLSPTVPLYIPYLGSLFAILFVKCFFGGLGKNFMNPALAGRCFLLISFSNIMSDFAVDGVSSATPLATLAAGNSVNVAEIFLGFGGGVIGCSAAALLLGGLYLWVSGTITFEIPVGYIGAFVLFMALFGGQGFDAAFLLAHLYGGGILMGAFFMATDPVTSPVSPLGQLVFGAICGVLSGLFRVYGTAADSVSYAIIISNMFVPFIDKFTVPKPFGYRQKDAAAADAAPDAKGLRIPKAALNLTAITLVAGLLLSSVYLMTKEKIEEQALAEKAESYQVVCPDAESFSYDDTLTAAVEALGGGVYDEASFGKTYVNEVVVGEASDGSAAGYVISVTSGEGFDGNITLSVGLSADGTVNGISFTELNETAGMGMRCDEDEFKGQFAGVKTDAFILNKAGGSTADNEIDSVSGASVSSGAVVNAVNTALAFFAANIG